MSRLEGVPEFLHPHKSPPHISVICLLTELLYLPRVLLAALWVLFAGVMVGLFKLKPLITAQAFTITAIGLMTVALLVAKDMYCRLVLGWNPNAVAIYMYKMRKLSRESGIITSWM